MFVFVKLYLCIILCFMQTMHDVMTNLIVCFYYFFQCPYGFLLNTSYRPVQLSAALKRTCQVVFDNGGTIRSLENLGLRQLPYAMKSRGHRIKHGNYFIINFDSSPSAVKSVGETLHIDEDILRQTIILKEKDFKRPCLEGSCVFGELPNPDHEKFVHKESLQRKLFPKKKVTSIVSKQLLGSK